MFYYFHHEREKWSLGRLSKTCASGANSLRNLNPHFSGSRIYSLNNHFPSCLRHFSKRNTNIKTTSILIELFYLHPPLFRVNSFFIQLWLGRWIPKHSCQWDLYSSFILFSLLSPVHPSLKSLSLGGRVGWAECSASIRFSPKGQLSTEFTQ